MNHEFFFNKSLTKYRTTHTNIQDFNNEYSQSTQCNILLQSLPGSNESLPGSKDWLAHKGQVHL